MHAITALPVVAPLAAVGFALMVYRLHRQAALTAPRVIVAIVACVYGAGVLAHTLFPIYLGGDRYHAPWRVFINLTPLANTDSSDMVQNVGLFLPLGLLLAILVCANSAVRVVLYGFLISLAMEGLQFLGAILWHGGHIADINDLVSDTAGVAIGYGIYRSLLLLPAVRRLAQATRTSARHELPLYVVNVIAELWGKEMRELLISRITAELAEAGGNPDPQVVVNVISLPQGSYGLHGRPHRSADFIALIEAAKTGPEGSVGDGTFVDPVCGAIVPAEKAVILESDVQTGGFCCTHCRAHFLKQRGSTERSS